MRCTKPKGLTIHRRKGHAGTMVAAIKSRGRTGARARSMFSRLIPDRQQSVLWAWSGGEVADLA